MQLVAGRITRPHGIRGEVVVEIRTDDPDERFTVGAVLATNRAEVGQLRVAAVRWHQGRLLVRFEGRIDRTSVEPLVGTELLVDPSSTEDPDEFYDHELVGLTAVDPQGAVLGTVGEVWHNPGHELLEISRPAGDPVLVPFVAAIVTAVDLPGGRVVLDPPAGLFDSSVDGDDADRRTED